MVVSTDLIYYSVVRNYANPAALFISPVGTLLIPLLNGIGTLFDAHYRALGMYLLKIHSGLLRSHFLHMEDHCHVEEPHWKGCCGCHSYSTSQSPVR